MAKQREAVLNYMLESVRKFVHIVAISLLSCGTERSEADRGRS